MMARLNKAQTYAISWLNSKGTDVDSIATELGLTIKQVLSVLEKNQPTKSDERDAIKTTSESTANKIIGKNLMINQTSSKKNNHVMIMTEAASMANDELKKNIRPQVNKNTNHIFRPNAKKRK